MLKLGEMAVFLNKEAPLSRALMAVGLQALPPLMGLVLGSPQYTQVPLVPQHWAPVLQVFAGRPMT